MNKKFKVAIELLITLVGITMCYAASAIQAFINIGQGPVGAFQLTTSYFTGIKMGVIAILFQGTFFIGQIIIEKRNWKIRQIFQMLVTAYGGIVLNYVLYTMLDGVVLHSYVLKMLIFIVATAVNAFGICIILNAGFIRVPMEGLLLLLTEKVHISLGKLKQVSDFILVAIVLVLTVACHYKFTIREGTVVNAILFGFFLDIFNQPVKNIFSFLNFKPLLQE